MWWPSSALRAEEPQQINVRDYGAQGNGTNDDTTEIQAAIDGAPDGSVIFFPQGTYLTKTLSITARTGLTLAGEGDASIIKRSTTSQIMTVRRAQDFAIRNLAFDTNGIERFGGIDLRACARVTIENNRFYDSNPMPVRDYDRYAILFGVAASRVPSEDIRIAGNRIEWLQVEVDFARRVEIVGNTSTGAVKTAAFGVFSQVNNGLAEDYLIAENVVINPTQYAFALINDPNTKNYAVFRRITIRDNDVRRTSSGNTFRLGTGNVNQATTGNVFQDITIQNNELLVDPAASATMLSAIFAASSRTAGFVFERLKIIGNILNVNRKLAAGQYPVDLRRLSNSEVTGNQIQGATKGIKLVDPVGGNVVSGNTVTP